LDVYITINTRLQPLKYVAHLKAETISSDLTLPAWMRVYIYAIILLSLDNLYYREMG